jgi:hypothetical protein
LGARGLGHSDVDVAAETIALIEQQPNLEGKSFRVTSPTCRSYNCAAWAAGEDWRKWDIAIGPDGQILAPYYWPEGVPVLTSTSALEAAYATRGYSRCDDGDLVVGEEKLAIYGDGNGDWKHVARQLPNGKWTSKMGDLADIEHDDPETVESSTFGRIEGYLSRKIPRPELPPSPPILLLPPGVDL